jgi:hypothetical protein
MFTTMIIMGVLGLVTAGMCYMAVQQPFNVRRTRDQVRAQAIAEAGANIAYAMLSTNFNLKDNAAAFPLTSYRGGTYDVAVTSMSATSAVITSSGRCNLATAVVGLDVINYVTNLPTGQPPPIGAYSNLVTSGGAISWGGTVSINGGGHVQANQSISMSGNVTLACNASSCQSMSLSGSVLINGNTRAPSYSISGSSSITGTRTTGSVSPVTIPTIDLTPYLNWANSHGEYYSGNVTINSDRAPNGGVMYVNGNISVSGNCTLTGCFIATGSISISGSGNQVQVNNYPAFISQNSSISISGSKSLQGLIYTPVGSVSYSGGGGLQGAIIAGGGVSMSGNVGIFQFTNPTPVPPGSGATAGTVGISGWRQ